MRMHTICNIQDGPICQILFVIQMTLVICNFPSLSGSHRWEPLLARWRGALRGEIWSGRPGNMRYALFGEILGSDPGLRIRSSSSAALLQDVFMWHTALFLSQPTLPPGHVPCLSSVSLNYPSPPGTVITRFITDDLAFYFLKQHFGRAVGLGGAGPVGVWGSSTDPMASIPAEMIFLTLWHMLRTLSPQQ